MSSKQIVNQGLSTPLSQKLEFCEPIAPLGLTDNQPGDCPVSNAAERRSSIRNNVLGAVARQISVERNRLPHQLFYNGPSTLSMILTKESDDIR